MKTGISTASMFLRMYNEDSLPYFNSIGVETCEVFLGSFCEYSKEYGGLLKERKGKLPVHSIHTLNTHFEPQLYTVNPRAKADAYKILGNVLDAANEIDAKNYTFHGVARLKKNMDSLNMSTVCLNTNLIIDECEKKGVSLCYENVHWAYYNYVGFFSELKRECPRLKGVLDVKQARECGVNWLDFYRDMGNSLATVHISDVDKDGKMCLPGRGVFNFKELAAVLKNSGFDGAVLIEVYKNDYKELKELEESYEFVKDIFG